MKAVHHLFMLIVISHGVFGKPQSSYNNLETGDSCILKDGTSGVCQKDSDCPYAIDLIRKNQQHKIVKCGFKGRNQIVCCSETRLSERFVKNILCENNLEQIPKKPIRFEDHIINGEDAESAEFPEMASLGYESDKINEDFEFRCGGTLISRNFVLTAAHCCNLKGVTPVIVRLGKTSLKDDLDKETGQDIKVLEVILHGNYSSRSKLNDIALLKLEKDAVLAHNVWPACLSGKLEGVVHNLTIIGFGKKNLDDGSTADWLLKATVDELALEECQKEYKTIPGSKPITMSQVCANSPLKLSDTCQGDSGGPLIRKKGDKKYIYGIVSYGIGCGSAFPSIYTRVDSYLLWIDQKMSSNR